MKSKRMILPVMMVLFDFVLPLRAQSAYTTRLDDPEAIYLGSAQFPAHADGIGDDSDAIQAAINAAEAERVETKHRSPLRGWSLLERGLTHGKTREKYPNPALGAIPVFP